MAGDWAYDELLPIAAVELMILGSAVVLCVDRRSHCLFPLPECPSRYAVAYVQLVRLPRRATRFLTRNYPSYVAFGSITDTNIASLNWRRCLGDYSFKDAKSCNAIPAKRFSALPIRQSGERRMQSVDLEWDFYGTVFGHTASYSRVSKYSL